MDDFMTSFFLVYVSHWYGSWKEFARHDTNDER